MSGGDGWAKLAVRFADESKAAFAAGDKAVGIALLVRASQCCSIARTLADCDRLLNPNRPAPLPDLRGIGRTPHDQAEALRAGLSPNQEPRRRASSTLGGSSKAPRSSGLAPPTIERRPRPDLFGSSDANPATVQPSGGKPHDN